MQPEQSTIDVQLQTFLSTHRVKRDDHWTHTTKLPSAVYFIENDELDKFMTIYCNAILGNVRPTISEKPSIYGPLRINFEFETSVDRGPARQYTEEMITRVIGYYQAEIKEIVEMDKFDDSLLCALLLEQPMPRIENGVVKDGFRIHFPHFICDEWLQDSYLRQKITVKMVQDKLWEGTHYSNSVDSFITATTATKIWFMYGSTVNPKYAPFMITRSYIAEKQIELSAIFEKTERNLYSDYHLPRFLSIRGYTIPTPLKPETCKHKPICTSPLIEPMLLKHAPTKKVLDDLQTIKDSQLMELLSDKRANNYALWLDTGIILFSIGKGCREALQLWIIFSIKSPAFQARDCEEKWMTMTVRDITIGSLQIIAQEDNPNRYKELKDARLRVLMMTALKEPKPVEYEIVRIALCKYQDKFICSRNTWFEFRDHRWHPIDNEGMILKRLLAETLFIDFFDLQVAISARCKSADDGSELDKLVTQSSRVSKMIQSLKTAQFLDRVVKMYKLFVRDNHFEQKLDANRNLFVCDNGVLDLELGLFRDGRPDDYCSLSCQYDFPQLMCSNDDEVMDVIAFFRRTFTNADTRNYFLDVVTMCLRGDNYKTLVLNYGAHSSGKSLALTFLKSVFGNYCGVLNRELLSGAPILDFASSLKGRRIVIGTEVDMTSLRLNIPMKLVGIDGRYHQTESVDNKWTVMLQCNGLPPGLTSEMHTLQYTTQFVIPDDAEKYPVPISKKEQHAVRRFHADIDLSDKLTTLRPALLWILFNRLKSTYGIT